ncbi:MAG: hypothetical protein Q9209_004657 [Squamulea sp. 1 TL-2023]
MDLDGEVSATSNLIEIYVAAEKFQLQGLKDLVLKRFAAITDPVLAPVDFLRAAEIMYARVPDDDQPWRDLFKQLAASIPYPNLMGVNVRNVFDTYIEAGGIQAVDLVDAICNGHPTSLVIRLISRTAWMEPTARNGSGSYVLEQ